MPCHKMAERHIEFTLTMCVYGGGGGGGGRGGCVFQVHVRPITSLFLVEFENHSAQMIIKTRQCVTFKNHVARSEIKVTVGT